MKGCCVKGRPRGGGCSHPEGPVCGVLSTKWGVWGLRHIAGPGQEVSSSWGPQDRDSGLG